MSPRWRKVLSIVVLTGAFTMLMKWALEFHEYTTRPTAPDPTEEDQVRAKLTAAHFRDVVLRDPVSEWDRCGYFSRHFAALSDKNEVVMGRVCCESGKCTVEY